MNQRRYRLIFNKVRGQLMAVAETAARQGKASGETRGPTAGGGATLVATVRPLAFALWGLLGLVSLAAEAQIVAYKAAPPSQRPTVLTAGNGVPLVNIQTPSAAGVSRNTYEQFDVATQGAILNNSRTNVQTQLGGWVQGNPWLATGSARVILNEVIAANPSQLLGHIEVAGASAQIVIANPAGITCSGCGFLNANRVTLTTGTPQINNGDLTGYRVTGGAIRIEGAGLDASQAGYTDLIARAVDINAGLWAQTLAVTTGANQVTADNTAATPIAGNGAAPAFALDVAHLGGMYAGKITLVGTEAGVGVRNAGQIGASVGNVVVTVDGQLINAGALQAGGNLHIGATSGLDNSGGALAAGQNLNLTAASLGNDNGEIGAGQQIAIDAAGSLSNRAGQIVAGTNLGIGAGSGVDNSGGLLSAGQALRLETGRLDNTGGTLGTVAGPLTARIGGPLANDGGQIAAGGDLGLSADSLAGLGDLFAQGNLNLQLASAYTHTGQLIAGGNLLLQTAGPLANQSIIQANGQLDIHAPAVDNTATGQILASDLALTTGALTNRGLIDGNRVRIAADVLDNLGSGRLYGGTLAIAADILNNRPEGDAAPLIAARDQLDLGVGSLDNGEASLIFSA
ncbi:MAG: filamentous hemagglutinin N-terminal domain-containing protein, partial [Betaproteobacteria bacterium]|nr:filamentous hemagglutinin N-terminal domain-containing protein [Betaproteobacteria bacterium]MCL2887577.1 filamentous hemagglutinin N-terminal domain-containing protein [Betaproteobacteria bacterium]